MLDIVVTALVGAAALGVGVLIGGSRRAQTASDAPPPSLPEMGRDGGGTPSAARIPSAEEVSTGIQAGEFVYHVQPIFDVAAGRMVGVEALSRWNRPDGEVIPPASFLPQMQRNYAAGLKPPLDRTPETAAPFTGAGLWCAFNVSATFLDRSGDETGWMDGFLAPLEVDRIVLEITEGSVISHPQETRRLVDALRERGVRFALDDFGTGLSNLERLQTYPVDFVKLDRRFVRGTAADRDAGILRALTGLRDDLGFEIIAEGIETEEERDRMAAAGIVLQQGFLHGRPAPVGDWAARIAAPLPA